MEDQCLQRAFNGVASDVLGVECKLPMKQKLGRDQLLCRYALKVSARCRRHCPNSIEAAAYFGAGQFKCRCRNAYVPWPWITWPPTKNSISVRSAMPSCAYSRRTL